MHPLSASALLRVWEKGYSEPPYHQALLLLTAGYPDESTDKLARLTIGARDSRLLALREQVFGPKMVCAIVCPACKERLEIIVNTHDIRTEASEFIDEGFSLSLADYRVDFRLPCSADLHALGSCGGRDNARLALIRRCVCNVRKNDQAISIDQMPAPVVDAVFARMAELDPQADTQLSLTCSVCNHHWQAFFDIVSFFWSEIQAWALRIVREVHVLASAYGWREEDILAMSPVRRQLYLGMVGV